MYIYGITMKLKLFRFPRLDENTPVGFFYNVNYTSIDQIDYELRDRLYLDVQKNCLTLTMSDDPYNDDEFYRPLDLQGTDRLYKYSDVVSIYKYLCSKYGLTTELYIEPFYVFINEVIYDIKDLLPEDSL